MSLYLKNILFKNFLCFQKTVGPVELPQTGLVLLQGIDKNTGSCSGVGKTSFLRGILYAANYCDIPATNLQNWYSEEPFVIQAEYILDGREITIHKTPGKTQIYQGDDSIANTNSKAEEFLLKNFRFQLSKNLFESITYRPQRKGGIFLSKDDLEKKELLSDLLGLEEIEKALKISSEAFEKCLEKEKEAFNEHNNINLFLAEIDKWRSSKEDDSIIQQQIVENREKSQLLKDRLSQVLIEKETYKSKYTKEKELYHEVYNLNKLGLLNQIKELNNTFDNSLLDSLSNKLLYFRQEISNFDAKKTNLEHEIIKKKAELQTLFLQKEELEEKRLAIQNQACYACGRKFDSSSEQQKKLNEIIEQEEIWNNKVSVIKGNLTDNSIALEKTQTSLASYKKEESSITVEYQNEYQKYLLFKQDKESKLKDLNNQINILDSNKLKFDKNLEDNWLLLVKEENSLNKEINDLYNSLKLMKNNLRMIQEKNKIIDLKEKDYQEKLVLLDQLKLKMQETKNNTHIEEDFLNLLGKNGFLNSIFEEILSEISSETNEIIKRIPNVSNLRFKFVSESETKSGNIKKKIVPLLYKEEKPVPLSPGLSGGQLTAIELAVDLALIKVISGRTGRAPGWLILDECFEGLSTLDKEEYLNILKELSATKLILVVDHTTETKGVFDTILSIEARGDESVITI